MTKSTIRIKGIKEGLLIELGNVPFDEAFSQLAAELTEKQAFLSGSRVTLAVGDRRLDRPDLMETQKLCVDKGLELWAVLADREATREVARGLGLATRRPGSNTDLEGNELEQAVNGQVDEAPAGTPAPLYLQETLRSGRYIYHESSVIILGDVNAGAEIMAVGDVIVWGRLRGLVHAGVQGDENAVICALELTPTQLRIASKIAVPPDKKRRKDTLPEKAYIRDGQIVADSWRMRD